MRRTATILLLVTSILLTGCGEEATSEPVGTTPSTSSRATTDTGQAPTSQSPSGEGDDMGPEELEPAARRIVASAITDLADRLGIDPGVISLISFERVTWRDGSLGCPQPGMAYTQALVDGSRTLLRAEGTTYAYHAGNQGEPFLCENPSVDAGRLTVPPEDES